MAPTAELANHLWQSTAFAAAVWLMSIGFRRNHANIRYWLWLSASLKFLLPFSLLIALGGSLGRASADRASDLIPAVTVTMMQLSQPFRNSFPQTPSPRDPHDLITVAMFGAWASGFAAIALLRSRGWLRIRAAVRSSTRIDVLGNLQVRSSPGLMEPGVVGLFRPLLLLPADISERLAPARLKAVLAHELCHARRHDNLTSAIHMVVEAVFWFHPLVWWIGARLVEERERACDEAVLSLGHEPRDYAQAILDVCKSYLESPLSCTAGVTGSDLKKRLRAILARNILRDLTFAQKLALTAAAVASIVVPVAFGAISTPHAGTPSPVAPPKFEVVSVRPCTAFRVSSTVYSPSNPAGRSRTWRSECTTLQHLVQQAGQNADGRVNRLSQLTVAGGPAWTESDLYEVAAKAEEPQSPAIMNGPVLQAILDDKFKLKAHRETKEVAVYELTVASGGPKLQPFQGSCIPWDDDHPNPGPLQCSTARATSTGIDATGWKIADLLYFFRVTLDRPVIDQTGITARFNFHLELPRTVGFFRRARGNPAFSDPAVSATEPALVSGIKNGISQLGLNLKPASGPGEFIIVDHVTKPASN